MKRLTLILGAAAVAVISVPTSARAQTGCSWWDLTCNGLATTVSDYAWHIAGRDQSQNVVYLRRSVDSNGNVLFEQSRRNDLGRYLVVNNHTIRKGTVYGPNGELCKYNESNKGYKEECKYAKGTTVSGIRYPSGWFATPGTDKCKYQSNEKGYKEECKYDKVSNSYKPSRVHTTKYKTAKIKPVRYEAPKVYTVKHKAPKVEAIHYPRVDIKGAKAPEGKDEAKAAKGPKH
jgi:hypothetical protein